MPSSRRRTFPRFHLILATVGLLAVLAVGAACTGGCGGEAQAEPAASSNTAVLTSFTESAENAFTVLVPKGWRTQGGIRRPMGPERGNPMARPRLDFTIARDAGQSVSMRWLPTMDYADLRGNPAEAQFPPGSTFNGSIASPLMDAAAFSTSFVLPFLRPQADEVRVVSSRALPQVVAAFDNTTANAAQVTGMPIRIWHDAAEVVVEYTEGQTRYRETIAAVLEMVNPGIPVLSWSNPMTLAFRAPAVEYDRWAPVADAVFASGRMNPAWVTSEGRAEMARAGVRAQSQEQMGAMIARSQRAQSEANDRMAHEFLLGIREEREYVNPHTSEVESAPGLWDYRWVNTNGDAILTDNPGDQPVPGLDYGPGGFQRSPVRAGR